MCPPTVVGDESVVGKRAFRITFVNGRKATRPCPCGQLGHPRLACRCTPDAIARYQGRISGPLLDRIDLRVEVAPLAPETLSAAPDGEATEGVARRVAQARERALSRQGTVNAWLAGDALDTHAALDAATLKFLHAAAARLGWSARSHHRVLRIARTIADLAGCESLSTAHVAEAMQYRRMPGG